VIVLSHFSSYNLLKDSEMLDYRHIFNKLLS